MSSSDSNDSTGSSQSTNSRVRSHKGSSPVDSTTQAVNDIIARKGVKSKVVRLHKAEKAVDPTSHTDESGNKSSQASSNAEKVDRSHKGGRTVDHTSQRPLCSRHWDDFKIHLILLPLQETNLQALGYLAPSKISPVTRQRLGKLTLQYTVMGITFTL